MFFSALTSSGLGHLDLIRTIANYLFLEGTCNAVYSLGMVVMIMACLLPAMLLALDMLTSPTGLASLAIVVRLQM